MNEELEHDHENCDDLDCIECCDILDNHEFDADEGGYCLNCGKHISD